MNCGIASIPTLRPWLTLEVPSFEHVLKWQAQKNAHIFITQNWLVKEFSQFS